MSATHLLTDAEVEAIRAGLRDGLAGPVVKRWANQLLADHDARVQQERQHSTVERVRSRYGRRQGADPDFR